MIRTGYIRYAFVALLAMGLVIAWSGQSKAVAATVSGAGYFTGGTKSADPYDFEADIIDARRFNRDAIPDTLYTGASSATIKSRFISWLDGHVAQNQTASTHNQVGGAFIVNTMLGSASGTRTRTVSTAMWEEVKARINRPDVTASVLVVRPASLSPTTSFYTPASGGDAFYAAWDPSSRHIIVFRDAGGRILFAIEAECGNPLGGFPGLPAIPKTPPRLSVTPPTCESPLIKGAAWDMDSFNATGPTYLNVQIYIDGPMGTGTRIANLTASATEDNGHKHGFSMNVSSHLRLGKRPFYVYARDVDPWGRVTTPASYATASFSAALCNDSSCGTTDFPSTMEVGQPQSFTTRVKLDYAWGSPYTVGNPAMHVTIWDPANTVIVNKDISFAPVPAANKELKSSAISFTPTTAGLYRMQWALRGQGLDITCPGPGTSNYTTGRASFLPYVSVYGGDVLAGSSPQIDTITKPRPTSTCSVTPAAGVYSWNTGSASNYAGAGASYAVMALGQIQDFASTQGSAGAPTRLSFANTGNAPYSNTAATGMFGGGAGSVPAVCDLISSLSPTTQLKTATPIGKLSVTDTSEQFVLGDMFIKGDITYDTTSWLSVDKIPLFKLIVVGDIYIHQDVTQLDGIYVAIPNPATGKGGNIYTCSTGGAGSATMVTYPKLYSDCNKRLVINGAFVAKSVQFLRTFGTMSKPGAAEQFNYGPELWLPRKVNSVGSDYSSITGLPPVL